MFYKLRQTCYLIHTFNSHLSHSLILPVRSNFNKIPPKERIWMPTQFIRMGFGIWDKFVRLRMSDKDMNILKWVSGSGFLTRELQLH